MGDQGNNLRKEQVAKIEFVFNSLKQTNFLKLLYIVFEISPYTFGLGLKGK